MGNSHPSSPDPLFTSACRAFSHKELDDLKSMFISLAAKSQGKEKYVSPSVFEAAFRLCSPLGERMYDLITQKRKDQKLTFEDLVIAKRIFEKGTNDEMEDFIYQMLDVSGDGTVKRSDLEAVLTAMLVDLFSIEPGSSSCQETVGILLNSVTFSSRNDASAEISMSFEDFRTWCALLPSVRKFFGSLLMSPDPGRPGTQVPLLLYPENVDPSITILRKEYAWIIGGALPQQEIEKWRLLYNSPVNGLSFTTFLANISNDMGPTVLIIKDNEGYIYGGYASQPWEKHGDFYGDMKSFLFQLRPKASIFRPSGANSNIQWFAVNFSSENIPNGIGFGGQMNYFGLFLSASFDQGHSFPCTTFGSPCLSKTSKIRPQVIECWGVLPRAQENNASAAGKGTVLDRFGEDRNMLKMVGLAGSSE